MRINKLLAPYIGLPKSIYVLFFATIVNNMGNFVAPFLTLFLKDKIGLDVSQVGILIMISSILGFAGSLIGGKLIDHIGRKKILVIFQGVAALLYIPCAFLHYSMIIPILIIISSFMFSIASPVHGTIATDVTNSDNRKVAFSMTYLAINIGFAVGPLIAGFLYINHIQWFFIGDAVTTLISIALVVICVEETMPSKEKIEESRKSENSFEKAEEGSLFSALLKRPSLIVFSLITVIYFFVFSQFTFGLSLQAEETFRENGSRVFGILMSVNAIVVTTCTIFITSLTKEFKSTLNIAIGGLLYAVGFGMMFFINSFYMYVLSAAIWTFGEIFVSTNTSVYIADHTPISHRGRFNSIFPIIRKAGFALGPMVTGIFIKHNGVRDVWVMIFGVSLIAATLMYVLHILEKGKSHMFTAEESRI